MNEMNFHSSSLGFPGSSDPTTPQLVLFPCALSKSRLLMSQKEPSRKMGWVNKASATKESHKMRKLSNGFGTWRLLVTWQKQF